MTAVLERTSTEVPLTLEAGEPPRTLGLTANLGLWANLGVTLTLPVLGGYLYGSGRSLVAALLACLIGSVAGSLLLGLAALAGQRTGAPGMVLLRGLLGRRGSSLPTVMNVLQCLGWTYVEVAVIAVAGHGVAPSVPRWVFVVVGGVLATLLALYPLGSVRLLRVGGVALMLVSSAYLFYEVLHHGHFRRGGSWSGFATSVDLVLALPLSWVPLVADYSRHARTGRDAFVGTFAGYATAGTAFFALGVLAVAAYPDATDGLGALVALPAAAVAVGILALDELDEAYANLYSTAVSVQNLVPRADRRWLVLGVGALATFFGILGAGSFDTYETFLFLLGAVFAPLTAVLLVAFFGFARGSEANWDTSGDARGSAWYLVPWAAGFAAYQLVTPTAISGWDGWATWWAARAADLQVVPTGTSATLASLVVAGVLAVPAGYLARRRRP